MALGGALGLAWSPVTPGTPRHFAWQAWHNLTSTVVLRGRRGTNSHPPSFCVAGVALMALGGALGLAWSPVTPGTPRHFAWQAWHKLTSTVVLRGRRGICVAGVVLMALGGALGLAWSPVTPGTPRHFARCCLGTSHQLCQRWRVSSADSDGEDTLEEQTAVLLQLPCKLEDVCAQLCEKLQKVPLPALGHVAAPVGSLSPVLCSTPPADALDDHVRCTVMALSGNVVAEVFVLKGQPWLDAIPFGCWCHCWNVANFHLSDKDMVVFPRPRLSQLVPSDGSDIVLKLITSNEPPPVNIRVGHRQGSCDLCDLQTAA